MFKTGRRYRLVGERGDASTLEFVRAGERGVFLVSATELRAAVLECVAACREQRAGQVLRAVTFHLGFSDAETRESWLRLGVQLVWSERRDPRGSSVIEAGAENESRNCVCLLLTVLQYYRSLETAGVFEAVPRYAVLSPESVRLFLVARQYDSAAGIAHLLVTYQLLEQFVRDVKPVVWSETPRGWHDVLGEQSVVDVTLEWSWLTARVKRVGLRWTGPRVADGLCRIHR